jgi:SagB-type dehydrogenase family enzyme
VEAAAIVVVTAVVERSLWKYDDRGYRYLMLEAGHVAQNINLCAAGLGLAALNLGGFFDEDMMALLKLNPQREIVLYGVALGHSEVADRLKSRQPSQADQAVRRF